MTLRLNGSTSGYVEIDAPAVAGSNTIVLPTSGDLAVTTQLGTRNRIINGDMRIDQRNAGASVNSASGGGVYPVDRFEQESAIGGGVLAMQQSSTAPTGFTNSLAFTVSTVDSSLAAGDRYNIRHIIEGYNVADLGFGAANAATVTLSFWVRSSVTGTYCAGLRNGSNNRSYVSNYTISSANTWEYKTITITGDTTGTWGSTNGRGIIVSFALASGTTAQTTANTWSAGEFIATSSQTNLLATNGATFYITGVQLEAGSVATPFERRSYGQELALCQRYCEVITPLYLPATYDGSIFRSGRLSFATTKRANPDSSLSGTAQWAIPGLNAFSANSITAFTPTTSTTGFHVYQNRQAGGATPTAGNFYLLETVPTITFSAEL
jgi:hypothetical protein